MLTAMPEPKRTNAATDQWSWLRKDLIAGMTVAAIAVPQAMAYALIAGIDPRFGLYTAIVMTALGSIFGSSSHLINGPTNAISLVVFSAIALLHANTKDQAYEAVFLLTMMVGTIQIAIALFKLGDLTRYISESVVLGFMAGAGCLIALSQVGNLLGLQQQGSGNHHLLYRLWLTLTEGGPINFRALFIGVLTVVLVISLRQVTRKYRLPRVDMLLALAAVGALAAGAGWSVPDHEGKALVAVVGPIPPGLPGFHFPPIELSWLREMAGSAAAIAVLGLLEAVAIAKTIAIQTREVLDLNRQCLAEGLANFFGGMFRCMPGSGSLTRSAINFQAGAVSRWSGVFAAGAVALVVVLLAPLAHTIPKASLGGILLVTAAGLFDRKRLSYALRASRYDASLVLVTAGAALFISVEFSILIGTALSILLYVPRAARLQATELTMGPDRVVRDRLSTDPPCNRLVLFDLEGELFFGAAPDLDRCLEGLKKKLKEGPRIVVLRLKRTRNPDVVCMERLEQFLKEMQKQKVTILLCGVRADFFQAMNNLRFQDWLPADCVFVENSPGDYSTLAAVRRAYELLAADVCQSCPRRGESKTERES
jgi:sulfate permease, SulP family